LVREEAPEPRPIHHARIGASTLLVLSLGYRIPLPSGVETAQTIVLNFLMILFLGDLSLNLIFEPDRAPWLKSHIPDLLLSQRLAQVRHERRV
jgi:hypothetical protein